MNMKRNHVRAIAVVGLLSILGGACGSDDDDDRGAGEKPSGEAAENPAAENQAAGGDNATISIKLIAFKPTEIDVPAGTTVTWKQEDVATHTVTSGRVEQSGGTATAKPDGKFDSGNIAKGQDFDFRFTQAGDFPFYCVIHPATMTGVVHVR